MTEEEVTAFRAAQQIRDRLLDLSRERLTVSLPTDCWAKITQLSRQIEIASAHGWPLAAQSLRTDLARSVDYCRERLVALFGELDKEPKPVPSLSVLYRDLLALFAEFEEVEIDLVAHEIEVATEPISLEGIFLGPFQIRLSWERLGNPSPYYVAAVDPHPASSNDGVTHPHVQDERLCEGDGRVAIQHALEEGRLGDFFLLVAQILRTYGKGSAYVELDNWDGVYCADCGGSTAEYEQYYCNRCDATLCGSCSCTCSGCDSTFCSGCLQQCPVCAESFCSSCLKTCKTCRRYVCNNCLTNRLCEKCHEKLPAHDADDPAGDDCNKNQCAAESGETASEAEPAAVGG
jgi:hypothetical protein